MKLSVIYLFLVLHIGYLYCEEGVCSLHRQPEFHTCCAMYYKVNGKCLECPIGTYRTQEPNCVSCKLGWYGKRCIYRCQCKKHERCDPIVGCLPIDPSIQKETTEETNQSQSPSIEEFRAENKDSSGEGVAAVLVIVLLVMCVLVSIILKRLYSDFQMETAESKGLGKNVMLCFAYYTRHLQQRYLGAGKDPTNHNTGKDPPNENTDNKDEEGHYCDIRESAMIQPLDLSVDLSDVCAYEDYNHLKFTPRNKTQNDYQSNKYTKINGIRKGAVTHDYHRVDMQNA